MNSDKRMWYALFGALVLLVTFLVFTFGTAKDEKKTKDVPEPTPSEKERRKKPKKPAINFGGGKGSSQTKHPLIIGALKGHSAQLLATAFSPDSTFVATASTDQNLRVIVRRTWGTAKAKMYFTKLEYSWPVAIAFSNDSKFLVAATGSNAVNFYAVKKLSKPELVKRFKTNHQAPILSVLLVDEAEWTSVCTCTADEVKVYNPKGELLETVRTNQMENFGAFSSVDNRFFGITNFTSELKLMEIKRAKGSGQYDKVSKCLVLGGHSKSVTGLDFNGYLDDPNKPVTRAVTCSKDGTWILWDIQVSYSGGENAHLLYHHHEPAVGASGGGDPTIEYPYSCIALSPDAKTVALAYGKTLHLFNDRGATLHKIPDAHDGGRIATMKFSPEGDWLLTTAHGSKHAKIWDTALKALKS